MWVNPQFYLLYSQLLNKFLTEKFIFLFWFVQVNRQKATVLHKKIKFSIKDFFGKCDQICRKQWIWSHLLKKSLMETSFIVQCVKKNTAYFLKNYVASLFTFFEKVFGICKSFTARCLDVRFWDLLYFICLMFNLQYWYLLLCREKMC